METTHTKNPIRYVLPTMLSNVCFLFFTIVDDLSMLGDLRLYLST